MVAFVEIIERLFSRRFGVHYLHYKKTKGRWEYLPARNHSHPNDMSRFSISTVISRNIWPWQLRLEQQTYPANSCSYDLFVHWRHHFPIRASFTCTSPNCKKSGAIGGQALKYPTISEYVGTSTAWVVQFAVSLRWRGNAPGHVNFAVQLAPVRCVCSCFESHLNVD